MFKYKGAECPYCHKELKETDEILICPDCGAPYHKECVRQSGGCVLKDLHAAGKMWEMPHRPSDEEKYDGMASRRCSRCGSINPPDKLFCEVCGNALTGNTSQEGEQPRPDSGGQTPPFRQMAYNPYTTPFGGLSPDEEIDGVPVHDLAIYVGQNTHYFLPKFKSFKSNKKVTSWNWSAFFLDFYYLMYRKMWGWAALMLALSLIFAVPSVFITLFSLQQMTGMSFPVLENMQPERLILLGNFFSFLSISVKLLLSATVNRLYANKALKDVKKLRSEFGESSDYSTRLSTRGGVSTIAVVISIVATIVISMGSSVLMTTLLLR